MRRLVVAALVAAVLTVALACRRSPTTPAPNPNPNNLPLCETEPRYLRPTDRVPCPSHAEIDRIAQDVPITFAGESTAGPLMCQEADGSADLTYLQAVTYLQIAYMRRVVFHTPLPWTDKSLYDWFRGAILGVVVETGSGGSYCCSPSRVIHLVHSPPLAQNPPWLTVADINPGIPVHEARHAERGPHPCIIEKTQTSARAADYTIADMGASGVRYLLYAWLAKYSDEPQVTKDYFTWCAWGVRNQYTFCNECYRPPPSGVPW